MRKEYCLLLFGFLLVTALVAGCQAASQLGFGKLRDVPPEYQNEEVGLYVHDRAERFFYPGTASLDMSDLMSFHLQQTLPFTSQAAFQEIFKAVEVKEPGPHIAFKSPDLAGYFEIKITSARYDWPDPRATKYLAEIQLLVEFKTMRDAVVWQEFFNGEGFGFSDTNIRLTRFGREAATALEDAFQNAVYEMQDAVLESSTLREYFRWYQSKKALKQAPQQESQPVGNSQGNDPSVGPNAS